jgi:hypothetical protein
MVPITFRSTHPTLSLPSLFSLPPSLTITLRQVVVEGSMCLGQLVVDKSTSNRSVREHAAGSFSYCDMLKVPFTALSCL